MIVGNIAYHVSGHGPVKNDGSFITGKVGVDTDLQGGYQSCRQWLLATMATLRQSLGSLDKVKRVIKVLGMVNSTPDFGRHPAVINGCSELFREVWGEDGLAAQRWEWALLGSHHDRSRDHRGVDVAIDQEIAAAPLRVLQVFRLVQAQ